MKRCIIPLICIYHLRRSDVTAYPRTTIQPTIHPPNFITVYTVTDRYFRQARHNKETRAKLSISHTTKRKTQCIISLSLCCSFFNLSYPNLISNTKQTNQEGIASSNKQGTNEREPNLILNTK